MKKSTIFGKFGGPDSISPSCSSSKLNMPTYPNQLLDPSQEQQRSQQFHSQDLSHS